MPKKIQEVSTALKLIRKFSLVGAFTPQLDETIVPVVLTDDLTDVELWRYAFSHELRIGVALQFNTWELANPANSGHVLELLHTAYVNSSGLARFQVHVNSVQVALANTVVPQFQELVPLVVPITDFPVGQFRSEGLLATLVSPQAFGAQVIQDTLLEWRPERTLLYPGAEIFFQARTFNQNGEFSIQWRERKLRADGS